MTDVNEHVRQILDSISDGFFTLDENLVVTYFNRAAEQMLGRKRDDVLGRPLFESFPEARGSIFEEKYRQAVRERTFTRFETYFEIEPYRNWYEVRVYPQEQGIAIYFQIDTERHEAIDALKHSEARFRAAQELSLDGFTVLESVRDEAGQIIDFCWTYVNPAAGRLLKIPPDENLVGQQLLELLPGNKESSELFERYVRVVETGEPHDIELYYNAEGIDGWFRNMAVKLNDGVAVSFSDITARKHTEKHLRLLEQVASSLSAALTSEQVMDIILTQGIEAFEAVAGSLSLLINDQMAEIVSYVGYPPELMQTWHQYHIHTAPLPVAAAIRRKEPVFLVSAADRSGELAVDPQQPVDLAHESWAALPLIVSDRVIGALGLSFPKPHSFDDEERHFMTVLAHTCAQALDRAQLAEQAKEAAAIAERQHLARELHDAVSQVLFSATTIAEALPRQWEVDQQKALDLLKQVVMLNRAAMAEMRSLLLELRPESVEHTELKTLLGYLVDSARGRKFIQAHLIVEGENHSLPPDVHLTFYRIAQESVNNILKHSQAKQFSVGLYQNGPVTLIIRDDGRGFDLSQSGGGLGLHIMRERADAIGAALQIISESGSGTQVMLRWNGR